MLQSVRILIIEDDALLLRVIERILVRHDLTCESDPVTAIHLVNEAEIEKRPFDITFCDLDLPGFSGIDVFDALEFRLRRPWFVLMTGHDIGPEIIARVDSVLTKPFAARELRACMAQLALRRLARGAGC